MPYITSAMWKDIQTRMSKAEAANLALSQIVTEMYKHTFMFATLPATTRTTLDSLINTLPK